MRVGIICYSHYDATISLGKYMNLSNNVLQIDFIFLLCQADSINVEIVDLKRHTFPNGFIDETDLRQVLDSEIFDYIGSDIGLKLFLFNSIRLSDLRNYKQLIELKNYIKTQKYDILHFVGNNPWIVFLNSLIKDVPKVHTVHKPYPFIKLNKYRLFRHKLNMKLLLRTSSHVIVPSMTSYSRLVSNFKVSNTKTSVIPFGPFEIYTSYLKNKIDKGENILLYYGYISKYKGVERLINAMTRISAVNPTIKLIIAGGGNINLPAPISNPNITIINRYLTNKEIAELNAVASIVICPYTSASQSGVVMTSFAFGNPLIATSVGALPEMIENNVTGIIIQPENSEELCKAILCLFNSPDRLELLRQNVVAKYTDSDSSWKHISARTFNLYRSLVKNTK